MRNKTPLQAAHDDNMKLSVLGRERNRGIYEMQRGIYNERVDREQVATDNINDAVAQKKADDAVLLIKEGIMPSMAKRLVEWSNGV